MVLSSTVPEEAMGAGGDLKTQISPKHELDFKSDESGIVEGKAHDRQATGFADAMEEKKKTSVTEEAAADATGEGGAGGES